MNTNRVIQGEDEETDIIYTSTPNDFYNVYEEEEVEEYEEDGDETIDGQTYEMYDEDIDLATSQHIQHEADLLFFAVEDGTSQPTNSIKTGEMPPCQSSQLNHDKTHKSNSNTSPTGPTPTTTRRHRVHLRTLPYFTEPNPEINRPHVLEIGSALRNTRSTAVSGTTKSRLSKECFVALNQSFGQLSIEIENGLENASWLDHFIILPSSHMSQK